MLDNREQRFDLDSTKWLLGSLPGVCLLGSLRTIMKYSILKSISVQLSNVQYSNRLLGSISSVGPSNVQEQTYDERLDFKPTIIVGKFSRFLDVYIFENGES